MEKSVKNAVLGVILISTMNGLDGYLWYLVVKLFDYDIISTMFGFIVIVIFILLILCSAYFGEKYFDLKPSKKKDLTAENNAQQNNSNDPSRESTVGAVLGVMVFLAVAYTLIKIC